MAIELTDDGTLDTVLRCSNCGEEFRFNFDGEQHITDGADNRCEQGTCSCYDDFVDDMIRETQGDHNCETDPAEERRFSGRE